MPTLLVHRDAGVADVGQGLQVVPVMPVWSERAEAVLVVDLDREWFDLSVCVLGALAERVSVEVVASGLLPSVVVAAGCS